MLLSDKKIIIILVYIGATAIMGFGKYEFLFVPDLPQYVPGMNEFSLMNLTIRVKSVN